MQMPIYHDGRRLFVGVDQGAGKVAAVPGVGQRNGTEIRFGQLDDGVGSVTLHTFLRTPAQDTPGSQTSVRP